MGETPPAWARRLTISATDWSVSRRSVSLSPRRICRNTGAVVDRGGLEPRVERPDSASVSRARVRHGDLGSCLVVGALGLADQDLEPARRAELEVLDVERDELRASERGGEAEQQQRAVALPGERGAVDRLEQPRQRVELERRGLAQRAAAVLAADPDITAATAPESHGLG